MYGVCACVVCASMCVGCMVVWVWSYIAQHRKDREKYIEHMCVCIGVCVDYMLASIVMPQPSVEAVLVCDANSTLRMCLVSTTHCHHFHI